MYRKGTTKTSAQNRFSYPLCVQWGCSGRCGGNYSNRHYDPVPLLSPSSLRLPPRPIPRLRRSLPVPVSVTPWGRGVHRSLGEVGGTGSRPGLSCRREWAHSVERRWALQGPRPWTSPKTLLGSRRGYPAVVPWRDGVRRGRAGDRGGVRTSVHTSRVCLPDFQSVLTQT